MKSESFAASTAFCLAGSEASIGNVIRKVFACAAVMRPTSRLDLAASARVASLRSAPADASAFSM